MLDADVLDGAQDNLLYNYMAGQDPVANQRARGVRALEELNPMH